MADISGSGVAESLAAVATSLKGVETAFAANIAVLETLLEVQSELLTEVLKSLGVGNNVDISA